MYSGILITVALFIDYQEIPGETGAGTLSLYTRYRGRDTQGASSTIAWLTCKLLFNNITKPSRHIFRRKLS